MPVLSGARAISGHMTALRTDRMGFVRRIGEDGHRQARLVTPFAHACVITDPAILQEVMVDAARSFEKADMTRWTLYPLAGEGLFTSRGDLWRRQRRLMAPLFVPSRLERYAEDMVACTERDLDGWAASGWRDGGTLEVARETTRITMSIAGKTLFDADTFGESDSIGAALTVALEWTSHHAGSPLAIAHILAGRAVRQLAHRASGALGRRLQQVGERLEGPLLVPGREGRELRAAVALLDARVQRMIEDRRASAGTREDLLSKLLSARDEDGDRMTDKQVRDEVLTLFVAGHETTANGLAWTLDLLARHPAWAAKVRAEVDAVGPRPTLADLPRLGLVARVFKEALRLYPPVYVFSRQATEEVVIGGYTLPSGTVVLICPWAIHRRPDVWPDAERFDPDRFLPGNEARRHKLAWLPFGAGPRVCIGNHFAMMEAQLVLATLLHRARFEALGPVAPDPHATLRPAGNMPMRAFLRAAGERRPAA